MTPKQKYFLVKKARAELSENPYDIGHELTHHYKVWDNCLHIWLAEDLVDVDLNLLEVAAWWHDVDRATDDHPRLLKYVNELDVDEDEIEKLLVIINAHSLQDEHSAAAEGRVLFDADKVESINPTRWYMVNDAVLHGEMSLSRGIRYCKSFNIRFEYVKQHLGFDSSKAMFRKHQQGVMRLIESGLMIAELADAIDVKLISQNNS